MLRFFISPLQNKKPAISDGLLTKTYSTVLIMPRHVKTLTIINLKSYTAIMRVTWDIGELRRLYHEEHLTLQEIGERFGVSRERIRQIMAKGSVYRIKRRKRKTYKSRFDSLSDYLAHHNLNHPYDPIGSVAKRFLPEVLQCSECRELDNSEKMHIHHIRYPATSVDDIQILCPSCHRLRHLGPDGMTMVKQLDLCHDRRQGIAMKEIAAKYNISLPRAYQIFNKFIHATDPAGLDNNQP